MSENTPAPAAQPERKRTSGILWLSLFSSLGFYMLGMLSGPMALFRYYELLGILPAGGLVLAILGFRAVRKAPELIGPKFAVACMVVAVVTMGHQSYLRYEMYPVTIAQKEASVDREAFFNALIAGNFEAVHNAMGPTYQGTNSLETTIAALEAALPGPDKFTFEDVSFRTEGFDFEKESKRNKIFFEGPEGVLDITEPYLIDRGEEVVTLDLSLHLEREGRSKVEVELTGFTVERGPKPKEEPADTPATGTAAEGE